MPNVTVSVPEELKQELDSLDLKGHEKEVSVIRSELKNVSDIPKIEVQIAELRKKLAGKHKKKRQKKYL